MEGFKINNQKKTFPEINFENDENSSKYFSLIKTEYLKNIYKVYFFLILLIVVYLTYQSLMQYSVQNHPIRLLEQLVIWCLLFIYLVIHFFMLSYIKFSPTTVNFLKRELHILGFELGRKYKIGIGLISFNIFTIVTCIFINSLIYFSTDYLIISLSVRLIIIYIFISITIPILRGTLHDKFVVKLKAHYFIQIDLQFKLIKRKEIESQMVRIYMTSNRLCSKQNQIGLKIINQLIEDRWLHRKARLKFPTIQSRSYLYFYEYSTPINFKEHFLNLVSAIREWDMLFKIK